MILYSLLGELPVFLEAFTTHFSALVDHRQSAKITLHIPVMGISHSDFIRITNL
ncbi:hypothetical protein [Colwellia sp. M166]|uniref:hypothetical protein n=1 Tax=Colwellia sp. M166 TaxID=2583805 RepID=UPI00211DFC40|nr:hypothetical protein [Colwellia sp. M166]|tara:strand:- start:622 stop:783 length:162 start_codon:yes stop_codon:yes gene_type:complete